MSDPQPDSAQKVGRDDATTVSLAWETAQLAEATDPQPQLTSEAPVCEKPVSTLLNAPRPTSIDEHVNVLFRYLFRISTIDFASMELYSLRDSVVGYDRLKSLILAGTAPEDIGERIASVEELKHIFNHLVVPQVIDRALGFACEVLATSMISVYGAGEETLLQNLQEIYRRLTLFPDPIVVDLDHDRLDFSVMNDWVEEQKTYGDLQDDLAWENGTKRKHRWDVRLHKSMRKMVDAFMAAATPLDWRAATQPDLDLFQPPEVIPNDFLRLQLVRIFRSVVSAIPGTGTKGKADQPHGPKAISQHHLLPKGVALRDAFMSTATHRDLSYHPITSYLTEEQLVQIGQKLREAAVSVAQPHADELFRNNRIKEAEEVYTTIVEAVLGDTLALENEVPVPTHGIMVDPAVFVNRAAAQLKLQR